MMTKKKQKTRVLLTLLHILYIYLQFKELHRKLNNYLAIYIYSWEK